MSKPFWDGDFAAVEARIVAWLARQDDSLERFRAYDAAPTKEAKHALDPYRIMATMIYGLPISQIQKFPHRFVGKESVLGAGFGLGGDGFRIACKKKGYDLPEGLEFKVIKLWRSQHSKIVNFWEDLNDAAVKAVIRKGEILTAGRLSFKYVDVGLPFLMMKLPSGRKLAYPWPKIVPGKFGGQAVSFYQNLKGTKWGHNSGIWGGVWCENGTQAVAADLMANGAQNCENGGYEIATLIHDQAIAYSREGQSVEEFEGHLTRLPAWAKDLPIFAEASLSPYYRKD